VSTENEVILFTDAADRTKQSDHLSVEAAGEVRGREHRVRLWKRGRE
jgi:hypothetical protein